MTAIPVQQLWKSLKRDEHCDWQFGDSVLITEQILLTSLAYFTPECAIKYVFEVNHNKETTKSCRYGAANLRFIISKSSSHCCTEYVKNYDKMSTIFKITPPLHRISNLAPICQHKRLHTTEKVFPLKALAWYDATAATVTKRHHKINCTEKTKEFTFLKQYIWHLIKSQHSVFLN